MSLLRRICLFLSTVCLLHAAAVAELRFVLRGEPRTFNPILADDENSETVRYLTGGVLIRLNRATQKMEPALAQSWKVGPTGAIITFRLRSGISFSDGTPFTADDVVYTFKQMMSPQVHSPIADAFRAVPGDVVVKASSATDVTIILTAPIAGLERLFDQVAIMSAKSPLKEKAVLGSFVVAEYKPGDHLLLNANPNYWKKDEQGHKLPYLQSIRLDIQSNRDTELLRFQKGEIQLINSLDTEYFDRLQKTSPQSVKDLGPSLDAEQFWFNQVQKSPIPAYKIAWFRSVNFRRAISHSINRDDIARLVFGGHAQPAVAQVSPANKFWFNAKLKPHVFNHQMSMDFLKKDDFHRDGPTLKDKDGHAVEFSIIVPAGNKARERQAALIQQDLAEIGMKVNIVPLDFPSLLERITQSFNYEACILGLQNSDLDPNEQLNVWLSSSENHQWDPSQKTPATYWEAEIDKLEREQTSSKDQNKRKKAYDRVQEIVWEQAPFLYLVNKNVLVAISPNVHDANPVVLRPQTYWNIDRMTLTGK
jgi:peptide/nickel transport system substrate-binding protein